ncbi:MAG TPA: hypothetical protein VLH84_00105 [Patescibacteria group bacterium]|nr:hypothetical protein [Patescibacteria group bacterium]
MIVALYGPDGSGKSTAASVLAEHGWNTFVGTDTSTWPDQEWHDQLTASGESEPVRYAHFLEKAERGYTLAQQLVDRRPTVPVAIDSSVPHKTLMHILANVAGSNPARIDRLLRQHFERFAGVAKFATRNVVHVGFSVSAITNPLEQARELQGRLERRPGRSAFDPTTVQVSYDHVRACAALTDFLRAQEQPVVEVVTDRPFNYDQFQIALNGLVSL